MIHRALIYLLVMRLKNSVLALLRRPGRLAAIGFLVLLFVMSAFTGGLGGSWEPPTRTLVLGTLLGFNLLLSVFNGFGEQGLGFTPGDVDFVFPAPFRRRELLVYHFMRHYVGVLFLGLMYTMFLGPHAQPVLTYVAIVLCLAVCTHLQAISTLVSASVSEGVFGRVRFAARAALTGLLVIGGILIIAGATGTGEIGAQLERVRNSWPARILLYPAVAAADVAGARIWDEAAWPLFGLWASLGVTFVAALAFRVNFLETSIATTQNLQKRMRGQAVATGGVKRSATISATFLRGPGAIIWLNLLTLRRRLRMLLGAFLMLVILLSVSRATTGAEEGGGGATLLVMLAFFALMANLPLGFRGHREHLLELKTLPMRPVSMAAAEVAVPALVLFLLQMAVVAAFAFTGLLDAYWVPIALAGYPALDIGIVALTDLFQLGRDPRKLGLFATMFQMMALFAALLPAMLVGGVVYELSRRTGPAVFAGVVAQVGVDLLVLHLLGRRFARFEAAPGDA
ncbi:MAG: putative ABC exporter domain-containing protein [Planctomycetota bacterium]|jgi:hypothetical protein